VPSPAVRNRVLRSEPKETPAPHSELELEPKPEPEPEPKPKPEPEQKPGPAPQFEPEEHPTFSQKRSELACRKKTEHCTAQRFRTLKRLRSLCKGTGLLASVCPRGLCSRSQMKMTTISICANHRSLQTKKQASIDSARNAAINST